MDSAPPIVGEDFRIHRRLRKFEGKLGQFFIGKTNVGVKGRNRDVGPNRCARGNRLLTHGGAACP